MPRNKEKIFIQKNRIKEEVKLAGGSQRLLSLWLNVNYTSISPWNTNKSQPEEENLDKIGELLEIDNRELLEPQGRFKTGLTKALEAELTRLNKEEGIPFEIERFDSIKNKNVLVNNPELIQKLKDYAESYKKTHGKISPIYIDKSFSEISKEELKGHDIIICNTDVSTLENPDFQVVHLGLSNKLVAKFNQRVDAENYVDLILRGYVQFEDKD